MQQKPRQIAARILFDWEAGTAFAESILRKTIADSGLKSIDRHMVQEMVFGVIRNMALLDTWIDERSNRPPGRTRARNILRLGLYQLVFMDRIPPHAAVHETVATARSLGLQTQSGFINAVLRGFLREKETILEEWETMKTAHPEIAYSHPAWLVSKWTKQYGEASTQKLLEWNNQIPLLYARWNPLAGSLEALREAWNAEGAQVRPVTFPWLEEVGVFQCIELPGSPKLLSSFSEGRYYIQDPSTLLAVTSLQARPGERIWDVCAAPGGKTCAIAGQMANQGHICATDPDPGRIRRLKENLDRMQVGCVSCGESLAQCGPASEADFDGVLVDAPCSNTGVLKRRLDVRWRLNPDELSQITEQQLAILEQSAKRVRSGGRLVYSTCSIEPEENEDLIRTFLATHANFKLETATQLTPFEHGVDGAYVAKLIRIA